MRQSLVLITPAFNDAEMLRITGASMAAQVRPPEEWVIVDDGSTDGTADVARELAERLPFARAVLRERRQRADGLAEASEVLAFYAGLATVETAWDVVGKLDSDLEFPPDYLERLLAALAADPGLGIVGGHCYERHDGRLVLDPVPDEHVRGATKLWTRACWEAIGGIERGLGWDTVDELRAWRAGFRTRSLPDLGLVHLRPMGQRGGMVRGMARVGVCAHASGCSSTFAVARSVKYAWIKRPIVLSGLGFAWGYARALVTRRPRLVTTHERRWLARRQHRRLLGPLARG